MSKLKNYLFIFVLIFVVLYPKFPLLGVGGTFVAIRLEDILIAITFLVFGILNIKKLADLNKPIQKSIILYWLVGFVSVFSAIFVTKSADLNLGLLHAFRRIEYMGMFMVGYWAINSKKDFQFLVKTILLISLIVGIYGLGQQFFDWPVISTNNSEFSKGLALKLGPEARVNSTFGGHYDLAAFSLIPLMWILAVGGVPAVVLSIIPYWAMLLSASRVTFVAFFAAAGLYLILTKKKVWILFLILVSIVSFFASPQLLGRYRQLIVDQFKLTYYPSLALAEADALKPSAVSEDRSLNIRLNVSWPKAVKALAKNPILGTGFSSIGLASDNDYLRMLAETGILGTVAFLLIIYRILILWFRSKDKIIIASGCALLALLLNAAFIDIFEASKVAIVFWGIAGAVSKYAQS